MVPVLGRPGHEVRLGHGFASQGGHAGLGTATDATTEAAVGHLRDALGQIEKEPLTALAKKQMPLAVDVLIRMALNAAEAGKEDELAGFVVRASAYASANPAPPWLAGIQNDNQFINGLIAELNTPPEGSQPAEALGGIGGWVNAKLQQAGAKLKQTASDLAGKAIDKTGNFASAKLLAWSRDSLNANLGRFFGDIFIYMNSRGDKANPGPIPRIILAELDDAAKKSPANEPLVIVGHSLGGVISMDLLGHFRPDIQVDLFVTVGSQVAHFEEIKLYKASNPAVVGPNGRAVTPANIRHWINIYDEVDIFSYAVKDVFERVDVDAPYDTQTYVVKSHSAYFEQDQFYKRSGARIEELTS